MRHASWMVRERVSKHCAQLPENTKVQSLMK